MMLFRWTLDAVGCRSDAFILSLFAGFKEGKCFPSMRWTAERLHISERAVRAAIERLCKNSWIAIYRVGEHRTRYGYELTDRCRDAMQKWVDAEGLQPYYAIDSLLLQTFGTTVSTVFLAILQSFRRAADLDENGLQDSAVHYGQEQLAAMCGCSKRAMKYAITQLSDAGIITKMRSNWCWKRSRLEYEVADEYTIAIIAQENESAKSSASVFNESAKSSASIGDESAKSSASKVQNLPTNREYYKKTQLEENSRGLAEKCASAPSAPSPEDDFSEDQPERHEDADEICAIEQAISRVLQDSDTTDIEAHIAQLTDSRERSRLTMMLWRAQSV